MPTYIGHGNSTFNDYIFVGSLVRPVAATAKVMEHLDSTRDFEDHLPVLVWADVAEANLPNAKANKSFAYNCALWKDKEAQKIFQEQLRELPTVPPNADPTSHLVLVNDAVIEAAEKAFPKELPQPKKPHISEQPMQMIVNRAVHLKCVRKGRSAHQERKAEVHSLQLFWHMVKKQVMQLLSRAAQVFLAGSICQKSCS